MSLQLHRKVEHRPESRIDDAIAVLKQRFGDRLHKHLFNGGALTPAMAGAIWDARAAELRPAIVAESARWGDLHVTAPYTPAGWEAQITAEKIGWFDIRTPILIGLDKSSNIME